MSKGGEEVSLRIRGWGNQQEPNEDELRAKGGRTEGQTANIRGREYDISLRTASGLAPNIWSQMLLDYVFKINKVMVFVKHSDKPSETEILQR